MGEFTITMAIVNFLPTLFSALAFLFIAQLVHDAAPKRQVLIWIGGALVVLGGLTKAIWKLIMATTGADLAWLANALFPLLGPGFIFAASGVWGALQVHSHQGGHRMDPLWVAFVVILLAFCSAAIRAWVLDIERGWFLPLLTLTTVGNLALSVLLIWIAARRRIWLGAALLVASLITVFALPPIAMIEPKSIAVHWLEQALTIAGMAAFAVAVYRLHQGALRTTPQWRAGQTAGH